MQLGYDNILVDVIKRTKLQYTDFHGGGFLKDTDYKNKTDKKIKIPNELIVKKINVNIINR